MQVKFDRDVLRNIMYDWRDQLGMDAPMAVGMKIYTMANRRKILEECLQTAIAWQAMLGAMTAEGEECYELSEFGAEVKAFRSWIEADIVELDRIR